MTRIIELHVIQNFAVSNLNRGETGSPKDAIFGGFRRARISSQCLKRAMRSTFRSDRLLDPAVRGGLAVRTKRLLDEVAKVLARAGKPEEEARRVAEAALKGLKLKFKEGKTEYLLFLGRGEIAKIAEVILANYDVLSAVAEPADDGLVTEGVPAAARGRGAKKSRADKQAGKEAVPKEVRDALEAALDGGKAADLALFGRMITDLADEGKNIDGSVQVAHALSTHKVEVEFDFFTAVDDMRPRGAGAQAEMLGTTEFNSACFYRYANLNFDELVRNLDGDAEVAEEAAAAFIRAWIGVIPTGKQNSMASPTPPSFVLAVARRDAPVSLANAFVRPVRATGEDDLIFKSVDALDEHWKSLVDTYGGEGIADVCLFSLDTDDVQHLSEQRVGGVRELVERMRAALRANGNGAGGGEAGEEG